MADHKPLLKLKSPCGQGYLTFEWNDSVNNKLPSDSIMETIRWVCKEYSVLKSIIDIKVIKPIDRSSYDDMQALCGRFNHVIDTFLSMSKGTSMVCGNPVASSELLKWILDFVYTRAVTQPLLLNKCKPTALPETYGETNYEQVRKILQKINIQPDDTFIDLGSGIGHIVLQVAASTQCKTCIGIEKESTRAHYALSMDKHFANVMKWFGKKYRKYQLITGDFLEPQFIDLIYQSSIIYVNNFAFREVNHKLKSHFHNLGDNTRIISTYPFRPESFRISDRNLDDPAAMMRVSKHMSDTGAFSWTQNALPYYIQVIDRSLLQEYYDNVNQNQDFKRKRPSSRDSSNASSLGGGGIGSRDHRLNDDALLDYEGDDNPQRIILHRHKQRKHQQTSKLTNGDVMHSTLSNSSLPNNSHDKNNNVRYKNKHRDHRNNYDTDDTTSSSHLSSSHSANIKSLNATEKAKERLNKQNQHHDINTKDLIDEKPVISLSSHHNHHAVFSGIGTTSITTPILPQHIKKESLLYNNNTENETTDYGQDKRVNHLVMSTANYNINNKLSLKRSTSPLFDNEKDNSPPLPGVGGVLMPTPLSSTNILSVKTSMTTNHHNRQRKHSYQSLPNGLISPSSTGLIPSANNKFSKQIIHSTDSLLDTVGSNSFNKIKSQNKKRIHDKKTASYSNLSSTSSTPSSSLSFLADEDTLINNSNMSATTNIDFAYHHNNQHSSTTPLLLHNYGGRSKSFLHKTSMPITSSFFTTAKSSTSLTVPQSRSRLGSQDQNVSSKNDGTYQNFTTNDTPQSQDMELEDEYLPQNSKNSKTNVTSPVRKSSITSVLSNTPYIPDGKHVLYQIDKTSNTPQLNKRAFVKKIRLNLKIKVRLKDNKFVTVNQDEIKGPIKIGSLVQISKTGEYFGLSGKVEKITDRSDYYLEFTDGKKKIVKRSTITQIDSPVKTSPNINSTAHNKNSPTKNIINPVSPPLPTFLFNNESPPSNNIKLSKDSGNLDSASTLNDTNLLTQKKRRKKNFEDFESSLDLLHEHTLLHSMQSDQTLQNSLNSTYQTLSGDGGGKQLQNYDASIQNVISGTITSNNNNVTDGNNRSKIMQITAHDTAINQNDGEKLVLSKPDNMDTETFDKLKSFTKLIFDEWCTLSMALNKSVTPPARITADLALQSKTNQSLYAKIALAEQSKRDIMSEISKLLQFKMNKLDISITKPVNLSNFAKNVVQLQHNLKASLIKAETEVEYLSAKNCELKERINDFNKLLLGRFTPSTHTLHQSPTCSTSTTCMLSVTSTTLLGSKNVMSASNSMANINQLAYSNILPISKLLVSSSTSSSTSSVFTKANVNTTYTSSANSNSMNNFVGKTDLLPLHQLIPLMLGTTTIANSYGSNQNKGNLPGGNQNTSSINVAKPTITLSTLQTINPLVVSNYFASLMQNSIPNSVNTPMNNGKMVNISLTLPLMSSNTFSTMLANNIFAQLTNNNVANHPKPIKNLGDLTTSAPSSSQNKSLIASTSTGSLKPNSTANLISGASNTNKNIPSNNPKVLTMSACNMNNSEHIKSFQTFTTTTNNVVKSLSGLEDPMACATYVKSVIAKAMIECTNNSNNTTKHNNCSVAILTCTPQQLLTTHSALSTSTATNNSYTTTSKAEKSVITGTVSNTTVVSNNILTSICSTNNSSQKDNSPRVCSNEKVNVNTTSSTGVSISSSTTLPATLKFCSLQSHIPQSLSQTTAMNTTLPIKSEKENVSENAKPEKFFKRSNKECRPSHKLSHSQAPPYSTIASLSSNTMASTIQTSVTLTNFISSSTGDTKMRSISEKTDMELSASLTLANLKNSSCIPPPTNTSDIKIGKEETGIIQSSSANNTLPSLAKTSTKLNESKGSESQSINVTSASTSTETAQSANIVPPLQQHHPVTKNLDWDKPLKKRNNNNTNSSNNNMRATPLGTTTVDSASCYNESNSSFATGSSPVPPVSSILITTSSTTATGLSNNYSIPTEPTAENRKSSNTDQNLTTTPTIIDVNEPSSHHQAQNSNYEDTVEKNRVDQNIENAINSVIANINKQVYNANTTTNSFVSEDANHKSNVVNTSSHTTNKSIGSLNHDTSNSTEKNGKTGSVTPCSTTFTISDASIISMPLIHNNKNANQTDSQSSHPSGQLSLSNFSNLMMNNPAPSHSNNINNNANVITSSWLSAVMAAYDSTNNHNLMGSRSSSTHHIPYYHSSTSQTINPSLLTNNNFISTNHTYNSNSTNNTLSTKQHYSLPLPSYHNQSLLMNPSSFPRASPYHPMMVGPNAFAMAAAAAYKQHIGSTNNNGDGINLSSTGFNNPYPNNNTNHAAYNHSILDLDETNPGVAKARSRSSSNSNPPVVPMQFRTPYPYSSLFYAGGVGNNLTNYHAFHSSMAPENAAVLYNGGGASYHPLSNSNNHTNPSLRRSFDGSICIGSSNSNTTTVGSNNNTILQPNHNQHKTYATINSNSPLTSKQLVSSQTPLGPATSHSYPYHVSGQNNFQFHTDSSYYNNLMNYTGGSTNMLSPTSSKLNFGTNLYRTSLPCPQNNYPLQTISSSNSTQIRQ